MSISNGLRRRNTASTERDREGVRINVRRRREGARIYVRRTVIRHRDRRRSAFPPERIMLPSLRVTSEGTDTISLNIPVRRSRQGRRNSEMTQNVGFNLSVAVSLMPDAIVRRPVARARSAAARTRFSYQPRVGPEGDISNRNTTVRHQEHRRWLQPNYFRNA
ncbi:uncharacterized protein LOC120628898 isoform X2 [Pararge aegeria]|nr:uncharacterized protein LOC120628898 isoform X2 [Pararge aegeria]